jgi:hypothetical protein
VIRSTSRPPKPKGGRLITLQTSALEDGTNELIIEVTNTWYNGLIGNALLPAERRTIRTDVTTSGGLLWAKLKPLSSGFFSPVRLIRR